MAKSKAKKHTLTHPTLDWNNNTGELNPAPEPQAYSLPYADGNPKGKQYGMRITVNAFHQLLMGALRAQEGQKQPGLRFVEFSKASIFRVLGQPGCEYIRFYFVYPEKGKMSLVLEGLDAAGQALKLDSHVMKLATADKARAVQAEDPVYEEVGNGAEVSAGLAADAASAKPDSTRGGKTKSAAAAGQASLAALLQAINTTGGQ